MEAKELKIGNYIKAKEINIDCARVKSLYGYPYCTSIIDHSDNVIYLTFVEPIQLTKEWLLEFGFDALVNGVYIEPKHQIVLFKDILGYYFEPYQGKKTIITYVHQLQNLYFALTHEELIYKD